MIRALSSVRTGLDAQQTQLDVIANNLANVNTTAFKKSRVHFQDLFYETELAAGSSTAAGGMIPVGIQVGLGTQITSTQKDFTQGESTLTGNELDLSINGPGFFQVLKEGEATPYYTRDGSFKRDGEGRVVTANGAVLQPPITIPDGTVSVNVDSKGRLVTKDAAETETTVIQINLHKFINPAGLKSEGGNVYTATEASGDAAEVAPGIEGIGTISQRYLETSNVNVTEEMVNLIITQRAFEVTSKAITTADQLLEIANALKR